MSNIDYLDFISKFHEIEESYEEAILKKAAKHFKISIELARELKKQWDNFGSDLEDVTAEKFLEALAENEESMAEMAAFAVTCEQFGIDEETAYDMLANAQDE